MFRLTSTLLALATAAAFSAPAFAAPVATLGSGATVLVQSTTANFTNFTPNSFANTTLTDGYREGGLRFSHNGLYDNNGCGYAGVACEDPDFPGSNFSAAFDGNYFGTGGNGAYVSIRSEVGLLTAIEFAVDSGWTTNIFTLWQTYAGGTLTGSGRVTVGPVYTGGVLGIADIMGFDEVRIYALQTATSAITTVSLPAIDSVVATVPEPTALALALTALGGLLVTRRRA